MITYGPPKKQERPGLLTYLEHKLGRSQGRGSERHFACPFCLDRVGSESSKNKLDVNIDKGIAACYRCNWRGNLAKMFREINGGTLTIDEAALIYSEARPPETNMRESLLGKLRPVQVKASALKWHRLPREYVPMWDPANEVVCRPAWDYWTRVRGLAPELVEQYQVGYCPSGDWSNRLVFPVFRGGSQVYFTTRYCGDHMVKAKNPEHVEGHLSKADVIWNYDGLVGREIVVVGEGVMSAMAFDGGCALLGKSISPEQIALLVALVAHGLQEIVVALDADAYVYAERMYRDLNGRVPLVTILHLDRGDPDDRRADLPRLLSERRPPDLRSRIMGRLVKSK